MQKKMSSKLEQKNCILGEHRRLKPSVQIEIEIQIVVQKCSSYLEMFQQTYRNSEVDKSYSVNTL